MSIPKISIIVPVYNAEQYINRMLDSILIQTFTDFELLLIDDGSKDSSGQILDEYSKNDNRIKVFHQQNSGPSVARNFGIEKASGYFLSFVDSDDELDPKFYESFFDNGLDFDAFYQGYIREYPLEGMSTEICPKRIIVKDSDCLDAIFYLRQKELLGWAWIKLFRRSIVIEHNIRFNTAFRWREDSLFAMQYCEHIRSMSVVPECHYHYYVYSNSLSRTMRDPMGLYNLGQEMWNASRYLHVHPQAYVFEQNYYWKVLRRSLFSCYKFGANENFRLMVINSVIEFIRKHRDFNLGFRFTLISKYYRFVFENCDEVTIDRILAFENNFSKICNYR